MTKPFEPYTDSWIEDAKLIWRDAWNAENADLRQAAQAIILGVVAFVLAMLVLLGVAINLLLF